MRAIQFDEDFEKALEVVADYNGVDKEKLWEMYSGIMYANYYQDLCDIARENEEELKGE